MSSEEPSSDGVDELLQFLLPERRERLEGVLARRTRSLTLLLDGVQNEHNVSAIIRSADAFGLSELHYAGAPLQFRPGVALGTERWVRLHRHAAAEDAAALLLEEGYRLVVLQPQEHCSKGDLEAVSVVDLPFEQKLALVLGGEKSGVSEAVLRLATLAAYIPMKGFVESLNVSVACAICLFCSTIAGASVSERTTPLTADEQESLRRQWLKDSVPRSETILRELEKRRSKA